MLSSSPRFGLFRPLPHARVPQLAHFLNQERFDLVCTLDFPFFSVADFQDRLEAFQEIRTLAQLGDVLEFFFGERDLFFLHPKLK